MNNLSSYCGLVDARMSASDKDLPVMNSDFRFVDFSNQSDESCLFICCCFFVKTMTGLRIREIWNSLSDPLFKITNSLP